MPSLRNLIDGKAVDIHSQDDVYKHLEKTKRAKIALDIQKAKLHSKLAPARKLLELVDQEHPLVENNGNPDNLQNPQLDQNGRPIPNQQAPIRPGIGQPQSKQQQPIQQKKPAFGNANKTSTKDKLSKDKDSKAKAKGKGIEVHVKAAEDSDVIDRMNVKKKKVRSQQGKGAFYDWSGREVGLSSNKYIKAGGPGSGRKSEGGNKKENQRAALYKDALSEKGYRKNNQETNARGQEVWKHKHDGSLITFHPRGATHFNSNGQYIKDVSFRD